MTRVESETKRAVIRATYAVHKKNFQTAYRQHHTLCDSPSAMQAFQQIDIAS